MKVLSMGGKNSHFEEVCCVCMWGGSSAAGASWWSHTIPDWSCVQYLGRWARAKLAGASTLNGA